MYFNKCIINLLAFRDDCPNFNPLPMFGICSILFELDET
jgi:hypothetical protein